uniref:Uncharacterized protein n=1 Tax=Oryza sativa subsp. japonica TaxID=39947 RepID=Q6EQ66_ORYSJ|nr:hypothetical protein [Oryza sativa Japonica Group]BAD29204.1 hypothetical protein [Oryza sativa Japonica Group]
MVLLQQHASTRQQGSTGRGRWRRSTPAGTRASQSRSPPPTILSFGGRADAAELFASGHTELRCLGELSCSSLECVQGRYLRSIKYQVPTFCLLFFLSLARPPAAADSTLLLGVVVAAVRDTELVPCCRRRILLIVVDAVAFRTTGKVSHVEARQFLAVDGALLL